MNKEVYSKWGIFRHSILCISKNFRGKPPYPICSLRSKPFPLSYTILQSVVRVSKRLTTYWRPFGSFSRWVKWLPVRHCFYPKQNSLFELFCCRPTVLNFTQNSLFELFCCWPTILHFTQNSLFELFCCRPMILHFTRNKTACSSYFAAGLRFYILPKNTCSSCLLQAKDFTFLPKTACSS